MNIFWFPLENILFVAAAALIGLCVHGFAHAWTAWRLGDSTARQNGMVSLNPKVHLDLMGSILMILAGFGWPKGTPIKRSQFKNPRLMAIVVFAAGPVSNLLLAVFALMLLAAFQAAGLIVPGSDEAVSATLHIFLIYVWYINLILFLFNLIPLPPLDAYRIVEEFLPWRLRIKLQSFEQWSFFLFLLIVFIPPLRAITLGPLFGLAEPVSQGVLDFFVSLFGGSGGSGSSNVPRQI